MLEGIDIPGIVAPIVTTAFGLTASVAVKVTIVCGGKIAVNMKTDQVTNTGGTVVQVDGQMYKDQNREQPDVQARSSTLIIDPSALVAACAAANGGAGVARPPLNNGDAIAIADNTGTKQWSIWEQNPVPGGLLLSYQIRR